MANTLLVGDDVDYIFFKLAIKVAQQGRRVWFISVKPFESLPKAIEPPCKDILQLIMFIYLPNFEVLARHFNGIHKWRHLPNVIILKSIDQYCSIADSKSVSFLIALLLDATAFSGRATHGVSSCVVSCASSAPKEGLSILWDLYFNSLLYRDQLDEEEVVDKIFTPILCETN